MTVYLVGAGPGDPGLITVRGAELLASADVVMYDRLSAAELLERAPADAEMVYVGKSPGGATTPQDEINRKLVEFGSSGRTVVRLKGGDPFVFARGAEEVAALQLAGIPVEVVPGITSAIAAPAYGGIPVTRRYSATSFTVVTGHEDPTKQGAGVDWESVARVGGTIVILMGVSNIERIAERLMAGGLSGDTPAAAVRWGTRPDQHTVRATLATLAGRQLAAPSVIVVGDVAGDDLAWFTTRPLFGRSVVVTRAPEQASRLSDSLRSKGATVIALPTIAVVDPLDDGAALRAALDGIGRFDWVIVTSPNGAARFLDVVGDARRLAGVELAAIGPGTASVLADRGLVPDLLPDRYVAEGLLDVFPPAPPAGGTVLIPQAAQARDILREGLEAKGWTVTVVEAYRTVPAEIDPARADAVASADLVAFASSSAVTNFLAAVEPGRRPPVAATIGPITAATARAAGFATVIEAEEHHIVGLVAAIERWGVAEAASPVGE